MAERGRPHAFGLPWPNVKATATQGPPARPCGLEPSSTRALGSQVSRSLDGSSLRAPRRCAELAECAGPKAAAGGESAFFSALPKPPACPGCALRCRWRGAHVFSCPRLATNWLPSPTSTAARAKLRRRAERPPQFGVGLADSLGRHKVLYRLKNANLSPLLQVQDRIVDMLCPLVYPACPLLNIPSPALEILKALLY